jgi:hypothetical protein
MTIFSMTEQSSIVMDEDHQNQTVFGGYHATTRIPSKDESCYRELHRKHAWRAAVQKQQTASCDATGVRH